MKIVVRFLAVGAWMAAAIWITLSFTHKARAQDTQEIKPYVFAELPHGRIYKAIHEGCELYIVESENGYTIATGRGCK
jgi:cbb3-type cytochrome oxidase cytochrome c subunit